MTSITDLATHKGGVISMKHAFLVRPSTLTHTIQDSSSFHDSLSFTDAAKKICGAFDAWNKNAPFREWQYRLKKGSRLPRGKFFHDKVAGKPFMILDEASGFITEKCSTLAISERKNLVKLLAMPGVEDIEFEIPKLEISMRPADFS